MFMSASEVSNELLAATERMALQAPLSATEEPEPEQQQQQRNDAMLQAPAYEPPPQFAPSMSTAQMHHASSSSAPAPVAAQCNLFRAADNTEASLSPPTSPKAPEDDPERIKQYAAVLTHLLGIRKDPCVLPTLVQARRMYVGLRTRGSQARLRTSFVKIYRATLRQLKIQDKQIAALQHEQDN